MACDLAEVLQSHPQNWIQVGKNNQPGRLRMLAYFRSEFQHVGERYTVLQRTLAGALDYWTVGDRITERHAKLNHSRARFDRGQHDFSRSRQIGIAAGNVRYQRRTGLK